MNSEELRRIKNKSIEQQNTLMFLEMKACSEKASSIPWLPELLKRFDCHEDQGKLILLSSVPGQAGIVWYGTWLSQDRNFYEFVVATSNQNDQMLGVESWNKATPEISANKQGIGKTPGYIALELLSGATKG